MIPMVDLRAQYHSLKVEIDAGLLAALEDSRFILGPNVTAFEREAAEYLGVPHAISCASGTDALHLALLAAGIGPGDEVITTAFTFIATAEAIRYVGADPVFVDIEPDTLNIDIKAIEAAITPRTKAVIPVHLFGRPAAITAITTLCKTHGFALVEDCAQSFGAKLDGKMTGSFGDFGCHSFFPSKNLGCYGDGGMVTAANDEAAELLRSLRNHGSHVRYHHDRIGLNSRLDELQAIVLRAKLPHIDHYNRERRRVANRYNALLSGCVTTPHIEGDGAHVFHQYTILSGHRDAIHKALGEAGIASAIYYPIPLHRQKVFAEACAELSLPVTEDVARRCLSLPIYPELADDVIVSIGETVRAAAR